MALPDWPYIAATAIRTGRIPTRRRRARWRADREFEKAIAKLQPGHIAIDCGANVGIFTRKMAATGATVYAFEPDPHAFDILKQNFSAMPHVKLFNEAVGEKNGRVSLYRSIDFDTNPTKETTSSSLFRSKRNINKDCSFTVDQIDLCAFIETIDSNISILKMDIEGAEVSVIEKMLKTGIIFKINIIFVETHENQIPSLVERTSAIRDCIRSMNLRHVNLDWH